MVSIIIPAYNEEKRIAKTLSMYCEYKKKYQLPWQFIVVLNGCTDATEVIVQKYKTIYPEIAYTSIKEKGKGIAIKNGFIEALKVKGEIIGFVDADGAVAPNDFHILLSHISTADVIIGSRYTPQLLAKRPLYKTLGRKYIYHPLLYVFFNFSFHDVQCGAKIFKKEVVKVILEKITAINWSIDLEILYLTTKAGYKILEIPIQWVDQTDSKFTVSGGISMFIDLFRIAYTHRK